MDGVVVAGLVSDAVGGEVVVGARSGWGEGGGWSVGWGG